MDLIPGILFQVVQGVHRSTAALHRFRRKGLGRCRVAVQLRYGPIVDVESLDETVILANLPGDLDSGRAHDLTR